jgi:hypothetical protein
MILVQFMQYLGGVHRHVVLLWLLEHEAGDLCAQKISSLVSPLLADLRKK